MRGAQEMSKDVKFLAYIANMGRVWALSRQIPKIYPKETDYQQKGVMFMGHLLGYDLFNKTNTDLSGGEKHEQKDNIYIRTKRNFLFWSITQHCNGLRSAERIVLIF